MKLKNLIAVLCCVAVLVAQTGVSVAPTTTGITQAAGDNSTLLATDQFVTTAVANSGSGSIWPQALCAAKSANSALALVREWLHAFFARSTGKSTQSSERKAILCNTTFFTSGVNMFCSGDGPSSQVGLVTAQAVNNSIQWSMQTAQDTGGTGTINYWIKYHVITGL